MSSNKKLFTPFLQNMGWENSQYIHFPRPMLDYEETTTPVEQLSCQADSRKFGSSYPFQNLWQFNYLIPQSLAALLLERSRLRLEWNRHLPVLFQAIDLAFKALDLEISDNCNNDYVLITNVNNNNDVLLRVCNAGCLPHMLIHNTKISIRFVTNSDIQHYGFRLDFEVIDKSKFWYFLIWVLSRRCGCFVTWFCNQPIAKPGNKTATTPWPDPYICIYSLHEILCTVIFHRRSIYSFLCLRL